MTQAEADDWRATRANYAKQARALSDPCRRKPSYSVAGRSVQWTEYQRFLLEQVRDIDKLLQDAGYDGPAAGGYVVTASEGGC